MGTTSNNCEERGYAVGVQDFDRIRESGAVYIDKTALVYKMVSTKAVNFFLSRPRRFGKSLLVDTLRCYFEGRRELFEGLDIYDLEKEWRQCPRLRKSPDHRRRCSGDCSCRRSAPFGLLPTLTGACSGVHWLPWCR